MKLKKNPNFKMDINSSNDITDSPIGAGLNKQFKSLKIEDISEGKNYRKSYTQLGINELSENILSHGLINPILVRPVKTGYEIVAGHRRYEAVCLLGWKEIDCAVIDISEDEAFEYSVIENLQRENVHPMDEAKAFQLILKNSTISQLAKRVNRSESYIARRLKLNDLTKEAENDFYDGHLELAHCIELCRLTEEQQKECLDTITENEGYGKDRVTYYESPVRLKAFIQRDILRKLSAAPFKKDDPDLYKKAGACTECPKRSGANKNLFNGIDYGDMCFDDRCYEKKMENFLINKIKELDDNGYDYYLITENYSISSELKSKYQGKKITTFSKYYDSRIKIVKKETKNSSKGLWIDGPEKGHVTNIEIMKDKTSGNHNITEAAENLPPKLQIEKINQRLVRAKEIDRGIVYLKLKELVLNRIKCYNSVEYCEEQYLLNDLEEELFWYAMFKKANYNFAEFMQIIICKADLDDSDTDNKISEKLRAMSNKEKLHLKRVFIKETIFPVNVQGIETNKYLYEQLVKLANQYDENTTNNIINSQKEVAQKREKNAAAKIKSIRNNKS